MVVRFLTYNDTMQTSCLRLMGKKLLVSLAMEGKFSNEGLQGIEDDDDVLTAMARELVTEKGVGESAACRMEGGSGATCAAPASFICPRGRVSRGICRFAHQRTGYRRWHDSKGLIFGTRLEKEPTRRRPLIVESDSQLSLF